LFALVGSSAVEDDGSTLLIFAHQTRVLEVCNEGVLSLNSGVSDRAHLLAVELLPFLVVELVIEVRDLERRQKIDESITDVALILEVDGQVKEVIISSVAFVDGHQQHLLAVFVRDVFDHQSGARVHTGGDAIEVENELHSVVRRIRTMTSIPRHHVVIVGIDSSIKMISSSLDVEGRRSLNVPSKMR